MSWGDRIRDAREGKGWTQAELAERLGISRAVVSRWENEHIAPVIPEPFNAVVLALGLAPDVVLQEMGVRLTPPAAARLPRRLVQALLAMPPQRLAALTELVDPAGDSDTREAGSAA